MEPDVQLTLGEEFFIFKQVKGKNHLEARLPLPGHLPSLNPGLLQALPSDKAPAGCINTSHLHLHLLDWLRYLPTFFCTAARYSRRLMKPSGSLNIFPLPL